MRTTQASGKLLGRATALWAALVGAALNMSVVLGWVQLDGVQLASIDTFALVLIGFLANEENPTTAGVLEGTTETPNISIVHHETPQR